ncbi:MAG: nuclear transport factor 2 family protein [Pseudomonadota bacterium]
MSELHVKTTAFFDLLNDTDLESRRAKARSLLASDLRYVDPHAPEEMWGSEKYLDFLVMFKGKFPELRFQPEEIAAHHGISKTPWTLVKQDGSTFSQGEFVLDWEDGLLIRRIFGFMR